MRVRTRYFVKENLNEANKVIIIQIFTVKKIAEKEQEEHSNKTLQRDMDGIVDEFSCAILLRNRDRKCN